MTRAELKQRVSDLIINEGHNGDPIELASCVLDTIDAFCDELEADVRELDQILAGSKADAS